MIVSCVVKDIRTTRLYDRRHRTVTRTIIERIPI